MIIKRLGNYGSETMKDIMEVFRNKKVLVTGHTGFKGSWLCKLLLRFGSKVSGISLEADKISLYNLLKLDNEVYSYICDIRRLEDIEDIIKGINPDIIFHLAAQPLVIESYNNPLYTFETNIIGTINILEVIRKLNNLECAIMITTDKVYDNKEWAWGYRENDSLGGDDPYSSSKACAELIIKSYKKSFLIDSNIATVRAGNVIGGGDFAKDRIIPDIVRAIENNQSVELRNPNSVRPWQHVLDVLNGYLLLAYNLIKSNNNIKGGYLPSYNFAPIDNKRTVEYITKVFIENIGRGSYKIKMQDTNKREMNILRLDSSLARKELLWEEKFDTEEAIRQTALWYREYLENKDITDKQINEYIGV